MYSSLYFLKYSDWSLEYFHVEVLIARVDLRTRKYSSMRIRYFSTFA